MDSIIMSEAPPRIVKNFRQVRLPYQCGVLPLLHSILQNQCKTEVLPVLHMTVPQNVRKSIIEFSAKFMFKIIFFCFTISISNLKQLK